jgi:hypothetical protein
MKDDLRYTPSDCFVNFPFPPDWQKISALETIGQRYYDYRAQLMITNNEGLTKTYHRFHDPDNDEPEIQELRRLHGAIDRTVADAYGWNDLQLRYTFEPDYLDANGNPKRIRYRWPDDLHDDVLGRLLALHQERHLADLRREETEEQKRNAEATNAAYEAALAKKDASRSGYDASDALDGLIGKSN